MQSLEPRQYPGKEQGIVTSYTELLSTCLRNCANAYNAFAMESQTINIPDLGPRGNTLTHPDPLRYKLTVRVLWAHVKDEDRDSQLIGLWTKANEQGKLGNNVPVHALGPYEELHHAIIEVVEKRGLLAGKIRRELVTA